MGRIRKDNPKIFCHLKPEAEKFLSKELAKIGRNKMGEYLSELLLAERDRKYPKTKTEPVLKQPESKEVFRKQLERMALEDLEREYESG